MVIPVPLVPRPARPASTGSAPMIPLIISPIAGPTEGGPWVVSTPMRPLIACPTASYAGRFDSGPMEPKPLIDT